MGQLYKLSLPSATVTPATLRHARELIEVSPHPSALWSRGRESCIFNAAAHRLFGPGKPESTPGAVWLERIHPDDRAQYRSTLERLYHGAGTVRVDYRFIPQAQNDPIYLTELSSLYDCGGDSPATWSIYSEALPGSMADAPAERRRLRDLLLGLNHDISNYLQVIKGEISLLGMGGEISQETANVVDRGVTNIKKLLLEIGELLSPSPLELHMENPAVVFAEVLRESEQELSEHQIRISFVLQEPLPALPIGRQFRAALREVIQFSCALLPQGGEVKIETRFITGDSGRELEILVVNASPSKLGMDEVDVFRPFLNINGRRVGLSMAVAREILRRHSGKIVFRREERNRGVFSIRLKMPSTEECLAPSRS